MKDKNNNQSVTISAYSPTTITALDNSVLNLSDEDLPEIPGLFVLSEYNTQYQQKQKQKKSFWKKLIKKRRTK